MSKHVKIPVLDPPSNHFDANLYPGDGVFYHSGSFWEVEHGMVLMIGSATNPDLVKADPNDGSVTENLLLKTLAVGLKPELAKDLR